MASNNDSETLDAYQTFYKFDCKCGLLSEVSTAQAGALVFCQNCGSIMAAPPMTALIGLPSTTRMRRRLPQKRWVRFQFSLKNLIILFIPCALLSFWVKSVGIKNSIELGMGLAFLLVLMASYLFVFLAFWFAIFNIPRAMAAFWDRIEHRNLRD